MNALQEIGQWLAGQGGDAKQLQLLIIVLFSIVGFTLSLAFSLFAASLLNPIKRRIDGVQQEAATPSDRQRTDSLLHRLGAFLIPKAKEKRAGIAYLLEVAGYRSSNALPYFYGIKLLGFILIPILVLSAIVLFTQRPVLDDLGIVIFSGVLAFAAPDYWLRIAVRKRQDKLRNALPDALDLMVVCSEAGLGLNAAIMRVADEIGMQHPELADELQLLQMQTRAGMDNHAALNELERRTSLDDISAFVTTLIQAMRFGTSIGQSLRVFAEEMRDKRLQRAQERAARLSLTMLMPIVLCMMPMFFLVLLGPAILVLTDILGKLTGG